MNNNNAIEEFKCAISYAGTALTALATSGVLISEQGHPYMLDREFLKRILDRVDIQQGGFKPSVDLIIKSKYLPLRLKQQDLDDFKSYMTSNTDDANVFGNTCVLLLEIINNSIDSNDGQFDPQVFINGDYCSDPYNYIISCYRSFDDQNLRNALLGNANVISPFDNALSVFYIKATDVCKSLSNNVTNTQIQSYKLELDSDTGLLKLVNIPQEFEYETRAPNTNFTSKPPHNSLSEADIESIAKYCDERCTYTGYDNKNRNRCEPNSNKLYEITKRLINLDSCMYNLSTAITTFATNNASRALQSNEFSGTWSVVLKVNPIALENTNNIEFPFIIITQKQSSTKKADPNANKMSTRYFINLCDNPTVIDKLRSEGQLGAMLANKCTSGLERNKAAYHDVFIVDPNDFDGFQDDGIINAFRNVRAYVNEIILVEQSGRIEYPNITLDPLVLLEESAIYYQTNFDKKNYVSHIISDSRLCLPLFPNGIRTPPKNQKSASKASKINNLKPTLIAEKDIKAIEDFISKISPLNNSSVDSICKNVPKYAKNWRTIITNIYKYIQAFIHQSTASAAEMGKNCKKRLFSDAAEFLQHSVVYGIHKNDGGKVYYPIVRYLANIAGLIYKMEQDPDNQLYTERKSVGTSSATKCSLSYLDAARILEVVLGDQCFMELLLEGNNDSINKQFATQFTNWVLHPKSIELIAYCATPLLVSICPIFAYSKSSNADGLTNVTGNVNMITTILKEINSILSTNNHTELPILGRAIIGDVFFNQLQNNTRTQIEIMLNRFIAMCHANSKADAASYKLTVPDNNVNAFYNFNAESYNSVNTGKFAPDDDIDYTLY